jgi:hypothetical protein
MVTFWQIFQKIKVFHFEGLSFLFTTVFLKLEDDYGYLNV